MVLGNGNVLSDVVLQDSPVPRFRPRYYHGKTQLGIAPHGTIHVVLTVEVVLSTRQAEGHVVDIDS